jgi:hypothetical protein
VRRTALGSAIPKGALALEAPTDMLSPVTFRAKLIETLRAIEPVISEPGVLVAGSEVPNLLEPNAAASLVVSQDVDIAVPVAGHARVKRRLREVSILSPSKDEPSVWLPHSDHLIEVNFIGMDSSRPGETYVFEDDELPLLVFGHLSLLEGGAPIAVDGLVIPVPRPAGLILEKLLTDRSGEKGDRDLLVVLGLLLVSGPSDLEEVELGYVKLTPDLRYLVRSNLSLLALLSRRDGMPDPEAHRATVAALLRRLEQREPNS